MSQSTLQAGLAFGMSATAGIHSSKPTPVSEEQQAAGVKSLLPADFVPTKDTRITFKGAKNDVHASPISIGAWSWGDKSTWDWNDAERPALDELWDVCLKNGINFIDTAQAYGDGASERITGELVRKVPREQVVVSPVKRLRTSLELMQLSHVDIYLVHGPIHAQSIAQVAKGMAECVSEGLATCIGVANYSADDMLRMRDELAKHGVPLATNQVEFHPIRRHPELVGLLQTCRQHGIVFQSYSSLAQGRLTGKYTPDNEPPSKRRFSSYKMQDLQPMLDVLRGIAERRGTSVSAVVLNYNMSKGVLPVVGMRKPEQAVENAQALGWRLIEDEVKAIDKVSFEGKSTIMWQQG